MCLTFPAPFCLEEFQCGVEAGLTSSDWNSFWEEIFHTIAETDPHFRLINLNSLFHFSLDRSLEKTKRERTTRGHTSTSREFLSSRVRFVDAKLIFMLKEKKNSWISEKQRKEHNAEPWQRWLEGGMFNEIFRMLFLFYFKFWACKKLALCDVVELLRGKFFSLNELLLEKKFNSSVKRDCCVRAGKEKRN